MCATYAWWNPTVKSENQNYQEIHPRRTKNRFLNNCNGINL